MAVHQSSTAITQHVSLNAEHLVKHTQQAVCHELEGVAQPLPELTYINQLLVRASRHQLLQSLVLDLRVAGRLPRRVEIIELPDRIDDIRRQRFDITVRLTLKQSARGKKITKRAPSEPSCICG
jgi:hypothetical protein